MNMLVIQLAALGASISTSSAGVTESNQAVRPGSDPQMMISVLTTNNQQVVLELCPPGQFDVAIVARSDMGWGMNLVITNLEGYWLALSMTTNRFRAQDELSIKLVLVNATTHASGSIRVDRGSVTGTLTGAKWELKSISGEVIESTASISNQASLGRVSGTSLLPGGNLVVESNVGRLFARLEPGRYTIRLNGVLPSIIPPSTQMVFMSAPLAFEIIK